MMAAASIACVAAQTYPTVRYDSDGEWSISMTGTPDLLRTKLEFDPPAGSSLKQHRTVELTEWQLSQVTGMVTAKTVGGFATLVDRTQATKYSAAHRLWTAPLTSENAPAGLTCEFAVSREGSGPIGVAVVCSGAEIGAVDFAVQNVGKPTQSVRLRASSTAGALTEIDGAGAVREIARKGTKTQPTYVWEAIDVPAETAFTTSDKRVVLTFATATVAVAVPKPESPVVAKEAADAAPEGEKKKSLGSAIVPARKLGAGAQTLGDITNSTIRTYGDKTPATVWWYGIAFAFVLLAGTTIALIVIVARMKHARKTAKADELARQAKILAAPGTPSSVPQ